MNLVQISTSIENGAYYYDPATGEIYHVPCGDLLELNHVNLSNVLGGLLGGLVVAVGMFGYAKNLHYDGQPLAPLLLLAVLILGACLFCWMVKGNQKRISRSIREEYRPVNGDLDWDRIMKRGRKVYVQILAYCVFLFLFAIISWCISVTSTSVMFALCTIVFFDTGVMMLAILQPLGKLSAYAKLRKRYTIL